MPIFERKQQQKEQVKPLDNKAALDELVNLLRIQNKDEQIFKVHLIAMCIEAYPIPLMVILGEHGSIKTTIAKSVKNIIDPSGQNISSLPTKAEDLILHFANRYLANFDNVSNISEEFSDILCKAITGEGQSKRKLYTDGAEIIFNYRRKGILNGIFPSLDRTDLRDRMIRYETLPVRDAERISEGEFNKHLAALLPHILGQIFQSLQKSLLTYDHIKNEIKYHSRMADFTDYGECISRALNYEPFSFVEAYKQKIEDDALDIVESYPIIQLIEIIMKERTKYEKTVL
jgi:ABC-type dipeptide/oligopeptide/nickel transport system ATPase component